MIMYELPKIFSKITIFSLCSCLFLLVDFVENVYDIYRIADQNIFFLSTYFAVCPFLSEAEPNRR